MKILGRWHYLYRGVDLDGQVLDCWLSQTRDLAAAPAFFRRTITSTGSVAFNPPKRTADPGLRVWEDEVYQGSGGGSGMGVWSRPDAHTVQYRLYCQVRGQVFTDGVLHQFEVPADEDARRDPGRGNSGRGPSLETTTLRP